MVICTGVFAQTTVTFKAKSDKGSITINKSDNSDELTKSGITIDVDNGVLGNGSDYRCYKNATLTVSSTVGNITKIVFTCTGNGTDKYSPSKLSTTSSSYSYSDQTGTWTGNATSVTFTASAQVRATKIEVTYTPTSSTTVEVPTFNPASGTYTEAQTVILSSNDAALILYTTDGTEPSYSSNSTNGETYDNNKGITVDKSMTIKAIAVDNNGNESSVSSATYTIVTNLIGDGSFENPYTVADVKTLYDNNVSIKNVWIKGVIVGAVDNKGIQETADQRTNIALAENTSSATNYVPVQLSSGNLQNVTNVVDNADNIGKDVKVYGNIERYFSMGGVKSTSKVVGLGSLSISAAGYATRYDVCAYEIPENVKGGIVVDKSLTSCNADLSGTLTIEYQFDATSTASNHKEVPAKAAVLLKGAEGTYDIIYTNSTTSAINSNLHLDKNMLHGGDAIGSDGKTFVEGTNVKYYMLSYGTGDLADKIAFFWGEADGAAFTYPAGKAFLAIDFGATEAKTNMFSLDGEATRIISVGTADNNETKSIYTITGQRIENISKAGLYIVNGKKIMVK